MFVKTTNGQVDQANYTIGDLRRDNPNVSFPKNISDELLAEYGVHRVVEIPAPEYNTRTQRLVTQPPALIDGVWTVSRIAVDKDPAQITAETSQVTANVRNERNRRLTASDWTQVEDAPVDKAAWAAYRQGLRDVPSQAGFPWDVTWPVEP